MTGADTMSSNLSVDVVIPTFNRKRIIMRDFSALEHQSIPPRSITVIDDSEDDLGPWKAISRNKGWRKGSAAHYCIH